MYADSMDNIPQWLPQWARKRSSVITKKVLCTLTVIVLLTITLVHQTCFKNGSSYAWQGNYRPDKWIDKIGSHGAVVSDVDICSKMGLNVLKQGGNAADAAVQVCLCIGSLEPQAAGIGGGGFINLRFPNGSSLIIDAREVSPKASNKYMFDKDPVLSRIGGLASGVPGELAGLWKLWELGGSLPWKELVDPVADLNENGFPRSDSLKRTTSLFVAQVTSWNSSNFEVLKDICDWEWLLNPDNSNIIRRPNFAATLRDIANEGKDVFYRGHIAKKLVDITRKTGGVLTEEDFHDYEVVIREPLVTKFQNLTLSTAPAPASGPALVLGLNVIDRILESRDDNDPIMIQRVVETMKWMAAARSELGDPAFIDNDRIEQIVTEEWAKKVISHINDSHTLDSWRDYHPSYEMNSPHGTTHFSIVDSDGFAISMTSTVNLWFGNFVCDPQTGIIMNSEMDDFSVPNTNNTFQLAPSVYNFIEPGKRPLSSTVPSILTNEEGDVQMVIGAAGGSLILSSVYLTIVRILGFDLPILDAVSFPRYHHQLIPETLFVEPGMHTSVVEGAEDRGHHVETRIAGSALNAIHKENGLWHAVGDFYRKRGMGAAY